MSLYAIGVDLGTMQAAGAVPTLVRKTVTFVAGTTGAVATHDLFTVTGDVLVTQFTAKCTVDLTTGGLPTIKGGPETFDELFFNSAAGDTFLITDWNAGMWLRSQTSIGAGYGLGRFGVDGIAPVAMSENVVYTIGTATITGGAIAFYLEYIPLSAGASVVAA